jgi:hypothetical protein
MSFVKGIGIGAAMLLGLSAPAQAGYVLDLTQEGSDIVAIGSGAIDLAGLSPDTTTAFSVFSVIQPNVGEIIGGAEIAPAQVTVDGYTGLTGPVFFGSGGLTQASSGAGDEEVGIVGTVDLLFVPAGYVSGAPLSDTATYAGQTFSSLGVTPGRYEWTWGAGADQNFTLITGTALVPEPSTWALMLLGFAGLGLMGYRTAGQRRRIATAAYDWLKIIRRGRANNPA